MNGIFIKTYLIFLSILLFHITVTGQDSLMVKGKIVGNKNEPLKDVSISAEGMDAAPVLTDENGAFTLKTPSGKVWLIIYPIGNYKSKRVFLNNQTSLVISLAEKGMKSGDDDVTVINLQQKRKDIIAASTEVDINAALKTNMATIDQSFQGNVPGVYTTNHSGQPGQGTVGFIRGIASMNTSNAPLYIIDGIPLERPGIFGSNINGNIYSPVSTIDPNDIERISIYKDPIVASVFGSKAANGIVFIETLQPKSTQTSIDASLQTGYNIAPNEYIPQLNSNQYKALANELLVSSPLREKFFEESFPGLYINKGEDEYYRYIHNTNWQKLIYSNSLMYKAHISVKGGSDIATYGLSVGYMDQGGVFENTNYNRFNVRFVGNLNVFSWFRMNVNANLSNNNANIKESAISYQTSPLMTSLSKPPFMSPYVHDKNGQKLNQLDDVDELGTSNPVAVNQRFQGQNNNYRFIAAINGQADISNHLKLNSMLGINLNTMKESVFKPNQGMETYYDLEVDNISMATNNYLYSFYNRNHLDYSREINTVHSISSSLGFNLMSNSMEIDSSQTANLPLNDEYTTLQSGQNDLRRKGGDNGSWNWMALYNQSTYKFKDKYVLNASLSIDYATLTGNDANTALNMFDLPLGVFYAGGVGWKISEENFLTQVNGLENLMLRLSYGLTGNNDLGIYNTLDHYSSTKYRETSGFIPGLIPNTSLRYEKFKNLNMGIDLSLWGGRTALEIDYYIKNSEDLLIYLPQNSYIGFNNKPINGGSVRNKGLDFYLFQRLLDGKNFNWDFSSSLSFLSNEVMDISGNELVTPFVGGEFITQESESINSFYGYSFEGVFATHQEAEEAGLVNKKDIPFGAGDAIYKDISGPENEPDGVIDDYDKMILGSPMPDFYGGFSNQFNYKRWSLNIFIQFVYGNEVFNYSRYRNERMVDLSNQSKFVLNRWQRNGDQTDVPRALWNDPIGNSDFSSRWIEDGSYLRVKNIRLAYTVPEKFLVFKNATFYITGRNLFTLDNYLGYDPEFSYSFDPMQQGIDYGLMPQYRSFMVGFNFGL